LPTHETFVAMRLAAAERLLAEAVARLPDEELALAPEAVAREAREA
jgi:hypothetical protein